MINIKRRTKDKSNDIFIFKSMMYDVYIAYTGIGKVC